MSNAIPVAPHEEQQGARARNAWEAPAPRELPELRSKLVNWADSKVAVSSMADSFYNREVSVVPVTPSVRESRRRSVIASGIVAKAEKTRLNEARLWGATSDMTSLAVACARTPPIEPISDRRLPSDTGMMLFDEPIGGYTRPLNELMPGWTLARPELTITTPIVAASWSRWQPAGVVEVPGLGRLPLRWCTDDSETQHPIDPGFDGLWVTFYSPAFDMYGELDPDEPLHRRASGTILTAGDVSRMKDVTRLPPLMWTHEFLIPWGDHLSQTPETDTKHEWLNVLYTAFQLITQKSSKAPPIVEIEEVQPDRARRRRNVREGITGPSGVNVVGVHSAMRPSREARERDAAISSGRRAHSTSYRYPVQPHRRNLCLNTHQHADGGCEHEDRLIGWHINGTKGMPLKLKDRVYWWDEQPS